MALQLKLNLSMSSVWDLGILIRSILKRHPVLQIQFLQKL